MSKFSLLAIAVAGACTHASAVAQPTTSDLEHISVYASRQAKPVSDVNASVTVFTRADIELYQPKDLPALLQLLPGVQLARQGSRGQNVSLFIRGSSSKHNLVLIDGIRVGSATSGYQDLSQLPLELIEKVELIRGARAAYYGSDAVGGVIAITTRQNDTTQLMLRGGSNGLAESALHTGYRQDDTRVFASVGYSRADGIHVMKVPTDSDPDRDGFRNRFVRAGASQQFSQGKLEFSSQLTRGDVEYDDGSMQWGRYADQSKIKSDLYQLSGEFRQQAADVALTHQMRLAYNLDDSLNYGNDQLQLPFKTTRQDAEYQLSAVFPFQLSLVSGISTRQEAVDFKTQDFSSWEPPVKLNIIDESRRTQSLFVAAQQQIDALTLDGAVRRDVTLEYGGSNTYQWGMTYQLAAPLQLRFSQGSAFKVPTFNDLYYPQYSNPELLPEQSLSREAGVRLDLGGTHQIRLDAVHFVRDMTNMIASDSKYIPQNLTQARLHGLEYSLSGQTGLVEHQLIATYTQGEYELGKAGLPNIPKQKYNYLVSLSHGNWQFSGNLLYRDQVTNKLTNVQLIRSAFVAGAGTSYKFNEQWQLRLNIENLLDRQYITESGFSTYYQPGREFSLTLQSYWF